MRIDEIDLYGKLLISGSTGSEGQILTYGNDGGFAWGTASGGSSGPTSSYFKTSGYNYVICETVNTNNAAADAIINGTNLINAYLTAKSLNVGVLSSTNRVVVLLMPGDYDLYSSQFQLDTSFIDLVGISSNPYNTILRSSTQFATLFYTSAVDTALKNVYLKQGTNLSVSDYEGAGDGSYLRWENLILEGFLFSDGSTYFQNIYGEFRNIKILSNSYYFAASGNIDGIFDNIESLGSNVGGFILAGQITIGSTLTGTFSNINFNFPSSCFSSTGLLSGYYENINILDDSGGSPFLGGSSINGTFKNIRIGGVGVSNVFSSPDGDLSGTFENIQISDAVNAFYTVDHSIYGTYKNIEIYNLTNNAFFSNLTMSGVFEDIKIGGTSSQNVFFNGGVLLGSFKNIEIGDVSLDAFSPYSTIDGTFENITIGNVGNNAFKTTDMISGSFKNITIGDITDITNNNAFYAESASGQINGTFDEIKIGNIASTTGYFFTSGSTMSGTFSNIEIGDASEWASTGISMFSGSITGSYKNIKLSNTSFLFYAADLNGIFENIEFGSTSYAFYTNPGSILGTYSNIKSFSPQERVFSSAFDLIGTFENIEFSNSITTYVFRAENSLSGIFKKIKLGDLSGIDADVFYSVATDLTGTFENIEVGNGNSSYDIFKSNGGNISGTFSNITVGGGWRYAFNASEGSGIFYGYYKDIYIPALTEQGFYNLSYAFFGNSVDSTTIIDNLWSDNAFTALGGCKLLNSYINGGDFWGLRINAQETIIENCKIIGDAKGPIATIFSNTNLYDVQILYTATNKGIYPPDLFNTGIVPLEPNYNITDAGLT
jgi:hypothetical protein